VVASSSVWLILFSVLNFVCPGSDDSSSDDSSSDDSGSGSGSGSDADTVGVGL